MDGLQVVCGSKFEWCGVTGWTNYNLLGPDFKPAFVGHYYTSDVGFYVKSHRTGATKLFVIDGIMHDEDGNYAGTRWVSPEGFRIEIEVST